MLRKRRGNKMDIEEKILDERSKEIKKVNKRFMSDTKSSEILIVILKAHLYMERELIRALTETIIDKKILDNTTFVQKLELAKSMGIIDDIGGALKKVNSIRNGYAHQIDYVFDERIFEDLLSTLTKEDKDDFLSEYEYWKKWLYDGDIPEFNFRTQLLLNNSWFSLCSCRAFAKKAIENRLREKELEVASGYQNEASADARC